MSKKKKQKPKDVDLDDTVDGQPQILGVGEVLMALLRCADCIAKAG